MAKLLKQKLSKILPSFQTCRNDDCDFPIAVTAARAPAIVSVACGCRPSPSRRNPFVAIDTDAELSRARETPAYLWRHDSLSPPPPPPRRKIDSRRNPNPNPRPSSSSGDSGWFSSDDEIYTDLFNQTSSLTLNNCDDEDDDDDDDETETLISSSFTDSLDAINLRKDVEKLTVKESFAVVKRSDDPYSDFRRSMAEMIVEKELYEPRDLEELLQCLLSLNSRHHHRAIISAFSEIWDSLFPATGAASGEQ